MIWEFSYESGMTVIHIEDFVELGVKEVIRKARKVVGDEPTYISLDVDGLDPRSTRRAPEPLKLAV